MESGIRQITIRDAQSDSSFPAVVQYPSEAPSTGASIGPYHFNATFDAPIAPGRFPVCVISHGGGGSHLLYRSIASYLARKGFIVVSPEHPGDNRNDGSLSNTDAMAMNRPRQASLAIDTVLSDECLGPAADGQRICALGHSMGGYTVLASTGGKPWSRTGSPIAVQADARVRAAVLLAPATDWFLAPASLADVRSPILVITGAQDQITPLRNIEQALSALPKGILRNLIVVDGAGHYSFLTPFPASMRRPGFLPATDPDGFDRERFHAQFPATIHEFLVDVL
ncbi:alpha/beta fold hydrolase [Variovorax sp. E3]|uniref:alpha/beta hydrolase family protein n=1 Tax=Variovorax sp. E3 TaxID=1914993 RepID=UPI0018DBE8EF|nr:alpha/beta fold hydrolase [Variovorax sp. E3]